MKAIIETGGKQYTVTEGTELYIEKIEGNEKDMDDELKATIIENMKKNGKLSRTFIMWFLI